MKKNYFDPILAIKYVMVTRLWRNSNLMYGPGNCSLAGWRINFDLLGHDYQNWVSLTFGCKLGKRDPIVIKLNTRHVVPPNECMYKVPNWYLKACWKKVRETRKDGRTDKRTDGHRHGIIRPFFKQSNKNDLHCSTLLSKRGTDKTRHGFFLLS